MKISRQKICSFIFIIFLAMITGTSAAENTNMSFVGHIGGWISNVDVAGNYAYVGEGQDFVVLDIKDVNNPREVGKVNTPGLVGDIDISGDYAYVTENVSLVIVDISNPSLPKIVGSYSLANSLAISVTVSGNYAYVSCLAGFVVLDVSNPSTPTLAGRYTYVTYPASYTSDIIISGNYAYVPFGDYGLHIVDISNPSSPTRISMFDTTSVGPVAISGNYAYATRGDKGLVIIDISNLSSPTLVGSYNPTDARPTSIAVSGNYAYIANANSGDNGLTVLDITNVSSPKLVGKYATGYSTYVTLSGNQAYVINSQTGLAIVSIANASSPKLLNSYNSIGEARDVAVSGNYAYLLDGYSGLSVIDVVDPSSPKYVGRYYKGEVTSNIALSSNYGYFTSGNDSLAIVDVSNPSSPKFMSSCYTGFSFGGVVALAGNYACVAYSMGLAIIDISNPSLPRLVGSYHDARYPASGIAVAGNYAYVANRDGGFIVIDITDPSLPKFVGGYSPPGGISWSYDIAVAGNYAYITSVNGLWVVNITNSSSPVFESKLGVSAQGIHISGNYAYVSGLFDGLYIVDITNPSSPIIVGHYSTAGAAYRSAVKDNNVYVADERNGLIILKTSIKNPAPNDELEKLQNDLNNTSIDTMYMYPVSEDDIQNYINQGYTQSEINQKLQAQTAADTQGRVLGAYIYAAENQQQKEDIQAIINKHQDNPDEAVKEINDYTNKNMANPSSYMDSVEEKFYSEGLASVIGSLTSLLKLSENGYAKVASKIGGIYSFAKDLHTEQEFEQEMYNSDNYVFTDAANALAETSKITIALSNLDPTGYYSDIIVETTGRAMRVATVMQSQKVSLPWNYKTNEEWKYVWADVEAAGGILVGNEYFDEDESVYVSDTGGSARIYRTISDTTYESDKFYIYIKGQPRQDWWGKIWNSRESGHWREVEEYSDGKWRIVSSSNSVSNAAPYLAGALIISASAEPNTLIEANPLKIYNISSQDLDDDGNAEVMCLDTTGIGESNIFYYDLNKDGLFEIQKYIDSNNTTITGYDITGDGKTDAYDMNGDESCDTWDLDGNGRIDQIDLNYNGKVDAYDSNNNGYLDIFVEYNHEIISWINSPLYGKTFVQGESVLLNGSVYAGAKKAIQPCSFTWNSNIDGLIGKGENISVSNLSAGNHTITLTVEDSNGSIDKSNVSIAISRRELLSVTDLQSTNGTTWINWTWTNPTDPDFNHIEIYLNGIFQTNTSAEYFNATGLEPETSYTLSTRTVDDSGNVNQTWVNSTATTEKAPMLPVANFSSNVSKGYAPLSVQFTDLSENATSWKWDFGDGANSTDQNPAHTYYTVGNYTFNLTASNSNGTDYKLATITVSEKPVTPESNFTSNVTEGYAPLSVQFSDLSKAATGWNWDFGDGKSSTEKNPIHKYSKAGNYTVALTATNEAGSNTTTKRNYIKVTAVTKPVANFTSNVTSGKAPLNVRFTDKSTGTPTSWEWSFGDGSSSTLQNPAYTYNKAGNYTVSLTVKNEAGTNTKMITNYITVKTAPVKPVTAFSATPTSGTAPLKVQFTDKSTNSPTSWKWSFGDGNTSTLQNPAYTYGKAGNYTVSLTVKNAAGSSTKTITNYITVKTTPVKPVAAFSGTPTSGTASLKVQFTDKSSNVPTSWKWSFGDGSTSTLHNPTYTYSKAGNYTVSLTVKNAAGSSTKTITNYITVKTTPVKPVAAFSGTPTSGTASLKVQFTDKSTNSPTSWKWSFGDSSTSTSKNPAYTYSKAGKYTVSLTVKNAAGSSTKTITNYITVKTTPVKPVAAFSGTPTSGKAPLKVQFTDKSTNSPTSWQWSFGDGTTSTTKIPAHKYTKAGKYTVKLTVKNAAGSNTITKTSYIKVTTN